MKTTKKLLVTLLMTIMLTASFGGTAFASEIDQVGALTEEANNTNNIVNIENTDASTDGENLAQDQTEDTLLETNVDEQIYLGENGVYVDEHGQEYVIDFVDEQGEVFYKRAEEATIEDTVEVEEDEQSTDTKLTYAEKDLRLLASLIYSEAGNQSYKGMLGVANVVLNRVHSDVYGHIDTVKEAIYDRKWAVQFAVTVKSKKSGLSMLDKALKCYDTGKFSGGNPEAENKSMQQAIKAAKAALQGDNNIGDFLCFQSTRSANSIKRKYSDYKIIGGHIFYRTN